MEDKVVHLTLKGYLNADSAIKFVYEGVSVIQAKENALVMIDCSDFQGLSDGAQGILALFWIQNKPYVAKEAIICLTGEVKGIFKNLLEMAGRSDVQIFDDKKAASAWLAQDT